MSTSCRFFPKRIIFLVFLIVFLCFLLINFQFFIFWNTDVSHDPFEPGQVIIKRVSEYPDDGMLHFHQVGTNDYAVAAFYDSRDGNMEYPFVRILMVTSRNSKFKCKLNNIESPKSSLYELSENHAKQYGAFILNCKIPEGLDPEELDFVEISAENAENAYIKIPITYKIAPKYDEYDLKMTMCVPVLFGTQHNAKRIIEFIELNQIQGINKIYLYHKKEILLDKNLNRTLQYYSANHAVKLISVDFPFNERDIWYHGQLLAVTDCLLRNTGVAKFTFFHDIDEFMIPATNLTLSDTIDTLFSNSSVGSQKIPMRYFPVRNDTPPLTLNNFESSKTLISRISKCVIRPEMVFEQGIHHTSRVIQDEFQPVNHDGKLLQLHHYTFKEQNCCAQNSKVEEKYGNPLREQFDFIVKFLDL